MLVLPSPRRISGAGRLSARPPIARWFAVLILLSSHEAVAQETATTQARAEASAEAPQTAMAARADGQSDADIRGRIRSIFSEVAGLRGVEVRVSSGVVTLTGTVATLEDVNRAIAIAGRVTGVVTVQNELERDLKVDRNLTPAIDRLSADLRGLETGRAACRERGGEYVEMSVDA